VDIESRIRRRVLALQARADHPLTPEPEAASSRAKAAELIARYGLQAVPLPGVVPTLGATPAPVEFVLVHRMEGFVSRSRGWAACCRCGYTTTPRVRQDRAFAALCYDHQLDVPECVLCGLTLDLSDWQTVRDSFMVFHDDFRRREHVMCRDLNGCLARSKEI
jgi:hypothetical protein